MTININTDSLGSILGAIVSITYAAYFLINYIVVERNMVKLAMSFFVFNLFIFLTGYAFYSSSIIPERVLFWTRVCYTGGALTAYSSYHLCALITRSPSTALHRVLIIYIAAAVVLIILPGEHLFTGVLNPLRSHSTVIKGPLFPYFLLSIIIVDCVLMGRFIKGLMLLKGSPDLQIISPLVFSFAFLLAEGMFNGIFGALLGLINVKIALGPFVMIVCMALYSARFTQRKNSELMNMKDENRRIVTLLIYDQLSGLYSRRYFQEYMEQRVSLHKREERQDCLMFLDVDNFKSVNDELGHQKGDDLITMMGEVIQEQSRSSDISARYGGDEFLILLDNCSRENAEKLAVKIQKEFSRRVETLFREWAGRKKLSMSIGIISSEDWLESVKDTIELADKTMYHSKKTGKNRISFFTGESPL